MPVTSYRGGANPGTYELLPSTSEPSRWQPATSIVVGFDSDEAGRAALLFAIELGGRLGARVHVVHAVTLTDYPVDPDSPNWEEEGAKALTALRDEVRRSLASYAFGWTYRACHGDAAAALADLAEQQDALVIVVGRHPSGFRERLRRSVAGSVSRRLPRRCGRPVVLVPPPEQPEPVPAPPSWPGHEELT